MPSISDTIRQFQAAHTLPSTGSAASSRLTPLLSFGSNPGALDGWVYVPEDRTAMALVVVLHGCTQTAAGYDRGSGWSDLAERNGFAVLFPEQQRANNPNLCFNWFQEGDTRRDGGEVLSIRQMIDAVMSRHPIDPQRVFVTGLSAGGAMANAMLATYPERFAGGSIIAGLPYGAAASIPQAMERMRGVGHQSGQAYARAIRAASEHDSLWPRITVWHGDADRTVDVRNADAIIAQWRSVHGAGFRAGLVEDIGGHQHRVWLDHDQRPVVEEYRIAGFGHGTPLKTSGDRSCGQAGAHMLEAGISSTWLQADSWGLIDVAEQAATMPLKRVAAAAPEAATTTAGSLPTFDGVGATIERALRSAGLMP